VFTFDPRVKNMCLVTLYVGYNNTTNLVIDYDSQLLLFSLVESYKSLLPTTIEEFIVDVSFASKFQGFVSNHQNNSKHIETPYVKGVDEFCHYLVDVDCKCALSWWWT